MIREKGSTIMRTNGALYRGHVINPLDKAFKNIRACESVVISKNFNKGALGTTTPKFGCGPATTTPIFSKIET